MVLLENDPFLTELGKLYTKTKTSGTVYITFKRVIEAQLTKGKKKTKDPNVPQTKAEHNAEVEPRCLIRATAGKKKISTIVKTKDLIRFQLAFGNIQKVQMDNLKKKTHAGRRGKKAQE
eukprot:TRINITY_DN4119_c0_g4_i2.p2 TRINITY_DN4119_c0_g4~~TRINITY_DN4119_c0_g4_i2.p2  ORF type:complete len:119 (-),score=44.42 TRINITY_DN4119_c0_g4_i2:86-442(-)